MDKFFYYAKTFRNLSLFGKKFFEQPRKRYNFKILINLLNPILSLFERIFRTGSRKVEEIYILIYHKINLQRELSMQDVALEKRVDRLEEALMELIYQSRKTEMEIEKLSKEMKEFKEEMKAFKDESKKS